MKQRQEMVAQFRACFGELCAATEHRHIEPYTRPRRLNFQPAETAEHPQLPARLVLALNTAHALLADWQEGRNPELAAMGSWQRYLALPRRSATDKLMAEAFRILRIFRLSAIQDNGLIQVREDGLIRASVDYNRCGLSLLITRTGLELLLSMVASHLESFEQPFSEAYYERLLGQYFADIVVEIRSFADEDRVLYQFRSKGWFNRHLRLDCDNPRMTREGDDYLIDTGKYGDDPGRHPIDYYITCDQSLYIVPAEALRPGGRLPVAELERWQARTGDANALPDDFRLRFAREKNVVGLPMT